MFQHIPADYTATELWKAGLLYMRVKYSDLPWRQMGPYKDALNWRPHHRTVVEYEFAISVEE